MSMSTPRPDKKYTYADYLKWPDDQRWKSLTVFPTYRGALMIEKIRRNHQVIEQKKTKNGTGKQKALKH